MLSRERYVVVSIICMAVITAMVLARGLGWMWTQFGLNDFPVMGVRQLPLTTVIAYLVSAAAGYGALKHPVLYQLGVEVVEELAKVTWPTRDETSRGVWVVVVTVIISSGALSAFDFLWNWMTRQMLGI